jgi:hypothetical protein
MLCDMVSIQTLNKIYTTIENIKDTQFNKFNL